MANEASVRTGLNLRKVSSDGTITLLSYNFSGAFSVTVVGTKGPTPGAITVTAAGTDVDLSQLTTPGLVVFKNLDATYTVEYGIRDPNTRTFYPLGEIQPGESYILRLSRNIQEDYFPSTGTGTTGDINKLHLKAMREGVTSPSIFVSVEAFEA